MNQRKGLIALISIGVIVGLGTLLLVLFQSMSPTNAVKSDRVLTVNITDIPIDSYRYYEWNGRPIAIFRPGAKSIDYLVAINKIASGPDYTMESIPNIFVYEPISTYKGCWLWPSQRNESLWPKYQGWYDPCHMGFWDYSGRNLPRVMAPIDTQLNDLTAVNGYRWLSKSTIELRP